MAGIAFPNLLCRGFVAGLAVLVLVTGASPDRASAYPVIQEVLYDGPSTDADDVFTEIFGTPGTDLEGWTLVGINGDTGSIYRTVDLTGAIIPADGILLIATESAVGEVLAQRDFTASVDWQNGPDAVQLLDPSGDIVDALQYGDAGVFNAGEGTPAPIVSAGQSLSRDAAGTDTDNNAADFTPLSEPTPGTGPPLFDTDLVISVPDTVAPYGSTLALPVRVTDTSGLGIVALEIFLSYDGSLMTADSLDISNSLINPDWARATNLVEGIDTPIDTFKVVMATGSAGLAGAGALFDIRFAVADRRQPAFSPLVLEYVLFNDGTPVQRTEHGQFRITGTDGTLIPEPDRIVPPAVIEVRVEDADEDRDPGVQDSFDVRVAEGSQIETLTVTETGNSTGLFTGAITTILADPVSNNGIIETQPGNEIVFCYDDSLDAAGQTVERCATTFVGGARDGLLDATRVVQPGDTLRVRVIDLDLNTDTGLPEAVDVTALNSAAGDSETVTLTEVSLDDSVFFGLLATSPDYSGPGDGLLTVGKGDAIQVLYVDATPAPDAAGEKADTCLVVGQFGDVDGNQAVQAFDASRVLNHVLAPFLVGLDSLAANVDSLAPFSAITPYDAALILQQRVGLRRRFPVQEPGARNHPQPVAESAAPRLAVEERLMALQLRGDCLSLYLSDRSEIVAGDLVLEGIAGRVEMGKGLEDFLLAWRSGKDGLHIVLAGAVPASGPGELLRIYPEADLEDVQIARARFNSGSILGLTEETGLMSPTRFALHPNYPNPFNPETTIVFELPRASAVKLEIFDLLGQRVKTLVSAHLPAGAHHAVWDGRNEQEIRGSSGVYLCRLRAGAFTRTRRMLLLE